MSARARSPEGGALKRYREKRDFTRTPEPPGGGERQQALSFVVQKHWAKRLHYDFRLELDGVMKSWAVPKEPSHDPHIKRMAVQVEDHPIAYNTFEGEIPPGQYGAGKVIIWDKGNWTPRTDPFQGLKRGRLRFTLHGSKLQGDWTLVRLSDADGRTQPHWLLIKDDESRSPAPSAPPAGTAAPPREMAPQLATLVDELPADPDAWIYEIKFDGYRIMTRIDTDDIRLFTRNGHDWSAKMPQLIQALQALELPSAWLDGEIVVLDDKGTPSFQALQNAFEGGQGGGIVYYVFDAPFLAGRDMRGEPLSTRRASLRQVIEGHASRLSGRVRFSEAFQAVPSELMRIACGLGLEGIMAKRADAPYVSRRTRTWLKVKCSLRQEFVIVGYTKPRGARKHLGALLMAVHDEKAGPLRYAGKVGTGFDERRLGDLSERLALLRVPRSPLADAANAPSDALWVKPVLLAEVSFRSWTQSGHIRQASFVGLRSDKPARSIVRETAMPASVVPGHQPPPPRSRRAARIRSTLTEAPMPSRLTHPDRVIDPSTGLTKRDLAQYDETVAPLLLPHLKGRPVSLVRVPTDVNGEHFFQKHPEQLSLAGVRLLPESLYPDHPPLMEIATAQGILSAAQMSVVEFHTWNALKTAIQKPDRMVFDIDPGEGVTWSAIQQATELVRVLLQELELDAWLKTSGGKGMHVVVPLRKQYGWDVVRGFSRAVTQHLARTMPRIFVARSGPRNRVGKIFVDYLRNGFGATTVSAWSARARPGMGISVPVSWEELPRLTSGAEWTLENIHARLAVGNSPWEAYRPQPLARAIKILGYSED